MELVREEQKKKEGMSMRFIYKWQPDRNSLPFVGFILNLNA